MERISSYSAELAWTGLVSQKRGDYCREDALLLILLKLRNGFLQIETSFVGGHVEKAEGKSVLKFLQYKIAIDGKKKVRRSDRPGPLVHFGARVLRARYKNRDVNNK
jgi:hypothetical protein